MSAHRTAEAAPLAAIAFGASLVATTILQAAGASDAVGIGCLAVIAIGTSAFGKPTAALAVSVAPAFFADHFFVAPYDSVDFAPRDRLVLLCVPLAGLVAATLVHVIRRLAVLVQRHRTGRLTKHDRWLLAASQPDRRRRERQSHA